MACAAAGAATGCALLRCLLRDGARASPVLPPTEPFEPPTPIQAKPDKVEQEEEELERDIGDLLSRCDALLAGCSELDATVAEFSDGVRSDVASRRRATRRLRKLRRPSGTGASSAALIAAGETVACVLRRKGGGGGGGGGGVQLLCGWTNEERTWEPLERVHAEHGMDAVRLLRSFDEAKRAESAPRDRGFRPENWDRELRRQARRRRDTRFLKRMYNLGIEIETPQGVVVWDRVHGMVLARRVDDISYLQQLPRDQLREALQHVQDFTPEHYELLLQLSEDDVPKTASEEQLSRVDFSYAVQDDCVCMVCLEDVVCAGARMPCGHTFHGPCLREYLGAAKACPLCKAEL
eukprot:TRINITY_DN1172_c0_g1_i11.p1 TRINITY_DN1172_c0_g1~~TRINITY_DN1172_c0_g1_i11.p1  ORF type:complete len:367 (+),score=123.98 TRINITY_DN1172_c0_g1_i11:51-1103(+)